MSTLQYLRPCDDIVRSLRNLADAIEKGDHKIVYKVAVVLENNLGYEVFGLGPNCEKEHASYLLMKGINSLLGNVNEED